MMSLPKTIYAGFQSQQVSEYIFCEHRYWRDQPFNGAKEYVLRDDSLSDEARKTIDGIDWKFRDGAFTKKEQAIIILALERLR